MQKLGVLLTLVASAIATQIFPGSQPLSLVSGSNPHRIPQPLSPDTNNGPAISQGPPETSPGSSREKRFYQPPLQFGYPGYQPLYSLPSFVATQNRFQFFSPGASYVYPGRYLGYHYQPLFAFHQPVLGFHPGLPALGIPQQIPSFVQPIQPVHRPEQPDDIEHEQPGLEDIDNGGGNDDDAESVAIESA